MNIHIYEYSDILKHLLYKSENRSHGECGLAWRPRTHHLCTGNVEQIWGMVAGRQGLRLQGAGILQLLDGGELGLIVA